ncbi:hypothetical protein [Thiothrix winogradskyi]|uniref:Uncharacterized protein n=1 Tax=Thiothrix winogradskyi TaxID=96472 RepID=A0ABY3T3Y9_9GAMM|nr:hypothetical protein [Thiothrix winogradskyi]UJS26281.1 hypothetical protein L2Y54_09640 [Thiothrix winogradskyi]
MNCCQSNPCAFSCDPPIPAYSTIAGRADWVRNFCKHPAKAGEKFQLTDTLLMPGHFIDWASFIVEVPSSASVPFKVGTEAVPDKYFSSDLNVGQNVKGFKDVREFVTVDTPVFITFDADANEGILGVAMWLADVTPMGTRLGGG